jgi:glycosyltransferase involved in cell wall biosynthesis
MSKVVFLNSHPIHYFTSLYEYIESKGKIDIEVLYCLKNKEYFDNEFNQKILFKNNLNFKHTFLKSIRLTKYPYPEKLLSVFNYDLHKRLKKFKRGTLIICHGWSRISNIYVLLFGKFYGLKVGLRSETPLNQEILNSRFKNLLKKQILKLFFKKIDYFLYIGEQNKRFYLDLGVAKNKLFFCPYSVDNNFFNTFYLSNKKENKRRIKKNILFVGKLIHKKRPLILPDFMNKIDSNFNLKIIGNGELKKSLEAKILNLNLQNRISLLGFKTQKELLKIYLDSDFLILPSGKGETWGLVVNEAINFELPLIISDMVGCSYDLINKKTGIRFECDNVDDLVNKFKVFNENFDEINLKKEMKNLRKKYSFETIHNQLLNII